MIQSPHRRLLCLILLLFLLISADPTSAIGLSGTTMKDASYTNIDIILLVSYILLALVFSFLCSVAEAVLLSITPSYIAGIHENRPNLGKLLKNLKQDNVDQSLAAILTLNTIAHTVGAIGSGSKATVVFGSAWFGLFSAAMTLAILFLSEIIPKTIGAVYWRKLASPTAQFVRGLIWALYPLIKLSESLTRLIARGKSGHVFSREEFIALADIGERSGQIDEHESRIIRNLFRFGSLEASDIMTPRTVIAAFSQEITVTEALESNQKANFSRLPLYNSNIDQITGFILRDDLLLSKAQDRDDVTLKTLKRRIYNVSAEMKLSDLLTFLLDKRQHIALVIDDFGEMRGLVTLEDVVETLLGLEIVDEMDKFTDMRALARQQWAKRARALGLDVPINGNVAEKSN